MNFSLIIALFLSNIILSLNIENQNTNLNSSLINEEEYFINDMTEEEFIKKNAETYTNFFNLEEGKNSYCELCQSGSDILLNTILQTYKWGYLHTFCTFLCSFSLRKDICYSAVGRYGPVLLESIFKRLFNREKICTSLFICKPSKEYESIEEYGRRILKNKNNNIKKTEIKEDNNINQKQLTFVQLADTHLQIDYQEGKVVNCNIPLCCRNTPEELGFKDNKNHKGEELKFSKKYGSSGKCDANLETLKAFSKEVKRINPDFILFTGDFSSHNIWEVSQEEVIKVTKISVDKMVEIFGEEIPIYPVIGNHEKAPPDIYYGSETVLLHGLSKVFRRYLTQEAYDTFSQFGYYTMLHKDTNLRLVSINCNVCNSMNFHLIGDVSQPVQMFKWLENVLSEAERNNEKVYLLDHLPLRSSHQTYDCSIRLKILIERYQDIISGFISSHTHSDEINLIKEYSNPNKFSIINYIGPALTTYTKYWPSYRIYYADIGTKFINDFVQMRLNLDETNKRDEPVWFASYQASTFFNVTKMNDYETISKANIDDIFVKHYFNDNPENEKEYTNPKVINAVRCYFQNDNYKDLAKCENADVDFVDKLYFIFNILFAYWPK